ncbi:hypothetical protein WH87_13250 [Devosia epidermidihirudinis]|uniref:Transglutaminase n=1 Tax=Devosia epidermidihirudinis TaxID=1293439 RepID=A0A0F5Q6R7_9HYPH|nr:transglutaminase-like cysteine peptidase [Devosia epidermidihirudinis]KKC36610.1 hypothetical protein WH87_13250 [Devosia epidermidihirudinis]
MLATTKGLRTALLGAVMALASLAAPALALDLTNVAFVQTVAGTTSIPVGHAEFCKARPIECRSNDTVVDAVGLDEALWKQLLNVNSTVNESIVAVTDMELYGVEEFWTYPNGYGDCEDIALEKRRQLINAGWPVSTLLMTVVREANGNGHAVLMVRTDRGDLVLDNQVGTVDLWSNTPYQFLKRQSQADTSKWVQMIDDRQIYVAAVK